MRKTQSYLEIPTASGVVRFTTDLKDYIQEFGTYFLVKLVEESPSCCRWVDYAMRWITHSRGKQEQIPN